MVHIICDKSSAAPIKCYSPDLIVHPLMSSDVPASNASLKDSISSLLHRISCLVVGPGLSKNANLQMQAKFIVEIYAEIIKTRFSGTIDTCIVFDAVKRFFWHSLL